MLSRPMPKLGLVFPRELNRSGIARRNRLLQLFNLTTRQL